MTPSELDGLMGDLAQLVRTLWLVLGSAAGLGVATMVILQLAKDLFPIRRAWQQRHITDWLKTQAMAAMRYEAEEKERLFEEQLQQGKGSERQDYMKRFAVFDSSPNADVARKDLIKLACAGRQEALYSLPVEQLAAQTSTALQFVVDYPAGHTDLLRILATGAPVSDLQTLFDSANTTEPLPTPRPQLIDARTKISHIVQRNLDAFQISIASRWKLYLQLVAILFSVGLMCFFVWLFPLRRNALEYIQAVVIGILGGFVSSVVWDLYAILRQQSDRA